MNHPIRILLAFSILLLGAPLASADSESELKARMSKRLPTVVALLKREAVGENNKATLTVRGALSASEKATVDAENTDRLAVYSLIASKAGTSATAVAQARAKQIRASAPAGTWVQLPDGSWKKA
jgi:uncharacterized protein YdbL (DUF1318 family)